ncbi:MAG: helix-hairpin-helix domain-containing protein [Bacteroidota bacterium]
MKSFFNYNNSQKNGTILLLVLLIIVLLFRVFIVPFLFKSKPIELPKELNCKVNSNKYTKQNKVEAPANYEALISDIKTSKTELFFFNPNNLAEGKWVELGLSKKQIKIIFNFESKGGSFRKKEDLSKIYGISKEEFSRLEPYILIPSAPQAFAENKTYTPKSTAIIELNSADSVTLTATKGIGGYTARKIIKYRNKLGGFYKKEQLFEIWGLDSNLTMQFLPYISVNSSTIKKKNINTAIYDSLAKHPYIDKYTASKIVKIRKVSGSFSSLKKLVDLGIISESDLVRIGYYFDVK